MVLKYGTLSEPAAGGGGTGAVNSVNGKTGDVLLTNDDVNAQKKTSALETGTPDVNDEVAFLQGGVSLRTAIENLPIPLSTRQALLGKLDASQKGAANGVAELDASGKLPVNRLPDAALGGLAYQGGWNATTNTPALTTPATRGYYWVVTTAGSTNIGGVTDWQVGDWVISNGTAWQKIDQTDVVTSVNGKQGAVVLTAADVGAQPADATLTALAALVATANKLAYFTGDDQMALADFTAFARQLMAAVDAAAARTTLDAQKADATLTALAGLSTGVDQLPYFTGTDQVAQTPLTAFARTLLDDPNVSSMRATLDVHPTSITARKMEVGAGGAVDSWVKLAELVTAVGSGANGFVAVVSGLRNYGASGDSSVLLQAGTRGGVTLRVFRLFGTDGTFGYVNNSETGLTEIWVRRTAYSQRTQVLVLQADNVTFPTLAAQSTEPSGITYVGNYPLHLGVRPTWSDGTPWDSGNLPRESGSFTPAVAGATTAGSCTYTRRLGRYARVGNLVHVWARVAWSGHTGAGALEIIGLPFAPNVPTDLTPMAQVTANEAMSIFQGGAPVGHAYSSGGAKIRIGKFEIATAVRSDVNVAAAGELWVTMMYEI